MLFVSGIVMLDRSLPVSTEHITGPVKEQSQNTKRVGNLGEEGGCVMMTHRSED